MVVSRFALLMYARYRARAHSVRPYGDPKPP